MRQDIDEDVGRWIFVGIELSDDVEHDVGEVV